MSARLHDLDALSRVRALTDAESLELEALIAREEQKRARWGSGRDRARAGVKRFDIRRQAQ